MSGLWLDWLKSFLANWSSGKLTVVLTWLRFQGAVSNLSPMFSSLTKSWLRLIGNTSYLTEVGAVMGAAKFLSMTSFRSQGSSMSKPT